MATLKQSSLKNPHKGRFDKITLNFSGENFYLVGIYLQAKPQGPENLF